MEKKTFPIWHCSLKAPAKKRSCHTIQSHLINGRHSERSRGIPWDCARVTSTGCLDFARRDKSIPPRSMKTLRVIAAGSCALIFCAVIAGCNKSEPIDEAKAAGQTTADFPQITADIFQPMDGGIELSPEEIMGRNTWNLWSGGN